MMEIETDLTAQQRHALMYTQDVMLERYYYKKAPSLRDLEVECNEILERKFKELAAMGYPSSPPIRVIVEDRGGGHFHLVPVLAGHIHKITITGKLDV